MTQIDLTQNLSGRKILKFPHCVFPIRLPRSVIKQIILTILSFHLEGESRPLFYTTRFGKRKRNTISSPPPKPFSAAGPYSIQDGHIDDLMKDTFGEGRQRPVHSWDWAFDNDEDRIQQGTKGSEI